MSRLECHFLIPITRDKRLGNGQPHDEAAWNWLEAELWDRFKTWTRSPGLHKGAYPDRQTGEPVADLSRRYEISLPNKHILSLRMLLEEACDKFVQECIYLCVGSISEDVYASNKQTTLIRPKLPRLKRSSLLFISTSKHKINEIRTLLDIPEIGVSDLDIPDLAKLNLESLVQSKIAYAKAKLPADTPFLIEHTALVIDGWNGLPGGLTKQFMETVGSSGICKMMKAFKREERSAIAKSVIGFHYRNKTKIVDGVMEGTIAEKPRGEATFGPFGWDNIFIPSGETLAIAELGQTRKNTMSMRRKAVDKLSMYLSTHYRLI